MTNDELIGVLTGFINDPFFVLGHVNGPKTVEIQIRYLEEAVEKIKEVGRNQKNYDTEQEHLQRIGKAHDIYCMAQDSQHIGETCCQCMARGVRERLEEIERISPRIKILEGEVEELKAALDIRSRLLLAAQNRLGKRGVSLKDI